METTEWAADEELAPETHGGQVADDLTRLHDVPVELSVEIGRTVMTLGQALGLGPGAIVELRRSAGSPSTCWPAASRSPAVRSSSSTRSSRCGSRRWSSTAPTAARAWNWTPR